MRAARYDTVGAPITVRSVPRPVAPPGAAVIDVRATGVCRSDWHAWRGHDPVPLPITPGHEFAGTVAALGEGVIGWSVGDAVVVPFVNGCGECEQCLAGDAQVCPRQTQPGFTHDGSFAEQVVVRAAAVNLVALPKEIDFVTAASLGCRFATAYRAVTGHGTVVAGQWLSVYGCGGVGLAAVQIGAALGLRVVGVDPSAAGRNRAAELGAEITVDPVGIDVAERVQELTGGVQLSIDAAGRPDTAVASVMSLRRRGRHVQVGLLLGANATPPLPMDRVIGWELTIAGSHGMAAVDYPGMLELVARGAVSPADLVGRVIGLDAAGEALAAMDVPVADAAGMTVIDLSR